MTNGELISAMESAMGVANKKQPRKPYTWRRVAGSRLGLGDAAQRRARSARTTVAGPPYSMPAPRWRQPRLRKKRRPW